MNRVKVRSLGLTTDLMLIGWDGVVDVLEGNVVRARSPGNPTFYFGNFLLFPDAPAPGDAHAWVTKFQAAFAADPRVRHVCLRWDRTDGARGAAEELRAAGFTIEESVVLRSTKPVPPPRIADAELRRIVSNHDWTQVEALQVATMVAEFGEHAGSFARAQMSRYRRFVSSGRGAWFGAFVAPRSPPTWESSSTMRASHASRRSRQRRLSGAAECAERSRTTRRRSRSPSWGRRRSCSWACRITRPTSTSLWGLRGWSGWSRRSGRR
jgi:hypothetical protein